MYRQPRRRRPAARRLWWRMCSQLSRLGAHKRASPPSRTILARPFATLSFPWTEIWHAGRRLDPALDVTFIRVSASKNAMAVNAWRYRRLLHEWRPDVLVTCNWGAIEFALANIVPVTRHLHVVDGFGPEERAIQIPRRVLTAADRARAARRCVVPSRNLVRIATRDLEAAARGHPLCPQRRRSGPFRHRWAQRGAGEPVIGTVAALRAEKNIARLLRAFAMLPAGRLVIVGDGPERPALGGARRIAGRSGSGASSPATTRIRRHSTPNSTSSPSRRTPSRCRFR